MVRPGSASVGLRRRTETATVGLGPAARPVHAVVRLGQRRPGGREWPIAQQRRQHVHSRIDAAELPVTHVTRRQGRPYTLVLNKTDALFSREQDARTRDETDLEWLATQWSTGD